MVSQLLVDHLCSAEYYWLQFCEFQCRECLITRKISILTSPQVIFRSKRCAQKKMVDSIRCRFKMPQIMQCDLVVFYSVLSSCLGHRKLWHVHKRAIAPVLTMCNILLHTKYALISRTSTNSTNQTCRKHSKEIHIEYQMWSALYWEH